MNIILVLLPFFVVGGWAQAPIEPLKRPEEPVGQYTWRIGIGYTPSGKEGLDIDELGRPYSYTSFSQIWQLSLSGSVIVATGLKMSFEIAEQSVVVKELRRYPVGEERLTHTSERLPTLSPGNIGWIRKALGIPGPRSWWVTLGKAGLVYL